MRVTAATAFVLALAGAGRDMEKVSVYVNSNAAPQDVIGIAEGISSRIFATVGVVVEWRSGEPRSRDKALSNQNIVVEFEMQASPDSSSTAMAYAKPYEGVHIVVFYDRIKSISRDNPLLRPTILAHVMTHEITHILRRDVRHSATGIMKARWDANDYFDMMRSPLPFAPEDIEMLRKAAKARNPWLNKDCDIIAPTDGLP
jgi:hypothetical protein